MEKIDLIHAIKALADSAEAQALQEAKKGDDTSASYQTGKRTAYLKVIQLLGGIPVGKAEPGPDDTIEVIFPD